jgi:hypothetical protein
LRPTVYLFTTWNTHPCFLDPADDYRAAFSIILVGNQIPADSAQVIEARDGLPGTLILANSGLAVLYGSWCSSARTMMLGV